MNPSCTDQAYRQILKLMADGQIQESSIMSHRALAARFGMSKLPVSQAIKRLEREGMVRSVSRVGTRVCRMDAAQMWGVLQWRVALECQTARLACECMTVPQRAKLIDAAEEVDRLADGQAPGSGDADVDFHLLVADLSRCARLRRELDRLDIYYTKLAICEAVEAARKSPPTPPPSHEALARTIGAGDVNAAEQCMRRHLEAGKGMYGFVRWYKQRCETQGD